MPFLILDKRTEQFQVFPLSEDAQIYLQRKMDLGGPLEEYLVFDSANQTPVVIQ